jgi:HSP20 family protein
MTVSNEAAPTRGAAQQKTTPRARTEDGLGSASRERWFDRWSDGPWAPRADPTEDRLLAPALDVAETDDAFTVTAELPGTKKDAVTVEFENGILSIAGEKTSSTDSLAATHRRRERRFGAFRRDLALPASADGERAEAKFENGVLEVRLPKREGTHPRSVRIT